MASEKELDDLLKQSASARSYALHTFEEEEKAEASKELSSMHMIADADESATTPASLFHGKSDSSVKVSWI
jgi:hypothetical protein